MEIDPPRLCSPCKLLQANPDFDVTHVLHETGTPIDLGGARIQYFVCPDCGANWCRASNVDRSTGVHWALR
ncbi:hypothetical protein [Paraburkholderia oxyphila]|uniref:hypothetical protein n=1 Tax=Paraburkholderia oxyphila TaxID=614212 RepID=UPI0004801498|nr:hypothetical protein [Paraburkholderia oxyphila]